LLHLFLRRTHRIRRPDPGHASVLAAVARFDQKRVAAHLIAGTREPVADPAPSHGMVPPELRARLVATFNSGFKMTGSHGGYYADHTVVRPLRPGAASMIIDDAGTISIRAWGADPRPGPGITAVRQNLALIVDHGAPMPGLDANSDDRWGNAKNQLQYTWRSAVGVDATGALFYVAGDYLTLTTLARALAATGAVRGMELDIHPNLVHLFTYKHPNPGQPVPTKLVTEMPGPADRYLRPDMRDFIALTTK
jgi:hypothetical protein